MENLNNIINPVFKRLEEAGFKAYFVGGCVRDTILNLEVKDFDIEVFGCSFASLVEIIQTEGKLDLIGQSFGIAQLTVGDLKVDFSIPRKENRIGVGHTNFAVEFDPEMSLKDAALRRDFTMNSLYYDPIRYELIDLFQGQKHLKNKLLVHVSDKFAEDPLRILRGLKFSTRFGMKLHPDTADMMKTIVHEISNLSVERIRGEWEDVALKGENFTYFFDYLRESGLESLYFQYFGLYQGCSLDDRNFMDKNVILLLDNIRLFSKDSKKEIKIYYLIIGLLWYLQQCFDGINEQFNLSNELDMQKLIEHFTKTCGFSENISKEVESIFNNLDLYFQTNPKDVLEVSFVRNFARLITPLTFETYIPLIKAIIHVGRYMYDDSSAVELYNVVEKENLLKAPMKPFLTGDILKTYGLQEGKQLGDVMREMVQKQDDGEINSMDEATDYLLTTYSHLLKIN